MHNPVLEALFTTGQTVDAGGKIHILFPWFYIIDLSSFLMKLRNDAAENPSGKMTHHC
jgi:hypothetical protein